MKYHHPSFLWELKRRFDATFDVYDHHFVVYVVTENKYFTQELLQGIVSEAIRDALISPQGTLDGPRSRSLFDAPPATHLDALHSALLSRSDYLQKREIQTAAGDRFEWRVDCRHLQDLISAIRREEDVKLATGMIHGDLFVSNRLLYKKILRYHGRAFSEKRIRELMDRLEELEIVKGNGKLRTYGRDILI